MKDVFLSDDLDYAQDCRAFLAKEKMGWANSLLWLLAAFLVLAVFWASRAELDEVTRGSGKVIPSSSVQLIQSLEGGLLESILVKEGETVNPGDVLVKIHDTLFDATYQESLSRRDALQARMARLRAESEGSESVAFSQEIREGRSDLVKSEEELFVKRTRDLETGLATMQRSLDLAQEELDLTRPFEEKGSVSRVEVLRLEREVNELKGSIANRRSQFQKLALEEFDRVKAELEALLESIVGNEDRVERTVMRAPVRGTVNKIHINTVGRVIGPGENIMEIVPLDDTLLIEANVRPADRAFLHPGQKAVVKVTAYDYAIYGALDGHVEHIGVDTITDEKGESFYQIKVRTLESSLPGSEGDIIPGMITEVDVLTGRKTVLHYLLKPINRARQRALRER